MPATEKSPRERFDEKWVPEPNTGCWLWAAAVRKTPSHDYMQPWFGMGKSSGPTSGARAAWRLYMGEIPLGAHVLHKCHNCYCVNPDHLYLGTHAQNMGDLARSCRGRGGNGATPPETVLEIRKRVSDGQSMLSVSKDLSLAYATVHRIVRGRRWASVQ